MAYDWNNFFISRQIPAQRVKLTFVSGSHLAPNYLKVVANSYSKKFITVNPRWCLVIEHQTCCFLETNLRRKFVPELS